MNDLFEYQDTDIFKCRFYDNGHKYTYDVNLSTKECSTFKCLCGEILDENEDAGTGC